MKGRAGVTDAEPTSQGAESLAERVEAWQGRRVLVVGDLMLDEYREGVVDRVSPEAPVPVVRMSGRRIDPGGAGNVARNVATLGARCRLIGVVGQDAEGDAFAAALEGEGLETEGVYRSAERVTTHKLRVASRDRQLLRLDREETDVLSEGEAAAVRSAFEAALPGSDVVILQDYDKGLFGEGLAESLIARARASGIPVVADPKNDLARFRGADLVKPNEEEARRFGVRLGADDAIGRAVLEKLQSAIGGGEVVVTRGGAGMTAYDRHGVRIDVPTERLEVFDVQGAGDTGLAALALSKLARASLEEACIVANAAAAIAVEKIGTAAVHTSELVGRLPRAVAAATRARTEESS